MSGVLEGFKTFLLRGNVVDLAVAVVVGTAFTAIVTAFTQNLINPVLAAIGGAEIGLGWQLGEPGNDATFVDVGAVITAAINFVIVAAVVYFLLVLPMNTLAERRKQGVEPESPAPAEDVLLLHEIRDLLASRRGQV